MRGFPGIRSQRHFRRSVITMLGAATVLTVALTPAVQARTSHRAIAAPQHGGTITTSVNTSPGCLDPARSVTAAGLNVVNNVLDTLVTVDPKGRLQPDLATKWKVGGGGTQITFTLRPGIRFSNGDSLNAHAVKFTFDRILNPVVKSTLGSGILSQLQKVTVVNKSTVRLTLKAPYRPLLVGLASTETGILDPKVTDPNGGSCTQVVGSGAFKFQSVASDYSTMVLVPNKYHTWNPAWLHNRSTPYVSRLIVKTITSDSTAVSELLANQVDVASIPGEQLSRVKGNKNFKMYRFVTAGLWLMGWNTDHPPFNNQDVRKAFAESIDKQAIIKAAYNGQAKAEASPISSGMAFHDKKMEKYDASFNPTDAQKIFQANHVTGPFNMLIYSRPDYETMAEAIQAQLAQEGVKINIVSKPPADVISQAIQGQFDILLMDFLDTDPLIVGELLQSSGAHGKGLDFFNVEDPALDQAATTGATALNQKKAQAAYSQLQKIILTKSYMAPILTTIINEAFRHTIKGIHLGFGGTIPWVDLYVKGS